MRLLTLIVVVALVGCGESGPKKFHLHPDVIAHKNYEAWQDKWFPGHPYWETKRPFKGTKAEVPQMLAELDQIIKNEQGTKTARRAAISRELVNDAVQAQSDDEFREKMAWIVKREYAESFNK